ncbi:hypothetical protein [Prevotella sp. 10(H)]|uniref:hypothetical protein n=1 Tax=Prevotella sp. 10(H) TaxID=1158294 RepID=UPI0004A72713|nr:hypothetical protein [Prevotella sp. 10(H)]
MKVNRIMKAILPVCILGILAFNACNSAQNNTKSDNGDLKTAVDTMKLNLDFASVDSMILMFPDSEGKREIEKADREKVIGYLTQFVNDTAWNNSGIMVKMVAPDYMLSLHYRGKTQDENSWISIWKELNKAKFDNKWYLLPGDKEAMFKLLDTYSYE